MNVDQSVLVKLQELPPDKQREVLDFVEFLHVQSSAKQPRRRLKGLCAGLNVHLSENDILEARSEMWGWFPRENV